MQLEFLTLALQDWHLSMDYKAMVDQVAPPRDAAKGEDDFQAIPSERRPKGLSFFHHAHLLYRLTTIN